VSQLSVFKGKPISSQLGGLKLESQEAENVENFEPSSLQASQPFSNFLTFET
jgi:hypothetical protein